MRALFLIFSIFSIALLNGCSVVRNYNLQEGIHSFRIQNYRHAFIRLKPEAERGNPDAQYAVGFMYYYGQGVVENRKKACYWISKAAKAGQPDAVVAAKTIRELPPSQPLKSNVRKVFSLP